MKKVFTFMALVLLTTMSWSQKREVRDLSSFTQVSFGVSGKLYLRQGNDQRVEIEADDETMERIEFEVRGDRLLIRSDNRWSDWWSWKNDRKVTVYITMRDIEGLSVSGSGDLIAETPVNARDLDLSVSGSGYLEAEIAASGNVEADVSGSGDMKLKGKCGNIESDISGSGNVYFTGQIAGEGKFDLTGSGKLQASGSAQSVKAWISGSGRVSAADLEAERCDVRISGSGNVQINVQRELNANISGSGSVSYRGNPSHVNSNSSGSGKVRKM